MTCRGRELESDMDKASANLEIIHGDGGEVTVFDVEFMRGAKASHTLSVLTMGGMWVYVDIAVDDYSRFVAMSLIHGPDTLDAPQYAEVPADGDEPLYENLAALAARVIELDAKGAIPKRFAMRDGQSVPLSIIPLAGLPIPKTISWRAD